MVKFKKSVRGSNEVSAPVARELKFEQRVRKDAGHRGETQWVSEVQDDLGTMLYIIPETAPVQPESDEIVYRCETGKTLFSDKSGFRIILVRILNRVIRPGQVLDSVKFEYGRLNQEDRAEPCRWRGQTKVGDLHLTLWVKQEQWDLLGAKVPGNNPTCQVRLVELLRQTPDGKRRIYGVKLLSVNGMIVPPTKQPAVDAGPDNAKGDQDNGHKPGPMKSLADIPSAVASGQTSESATPVTPATSSSASTAAITELAPPVPEVNAPAKRRANGKKGRKALTPAGSDPAEDAKREPATV